MTTDDELGRLWRDYRDRPLLRKTRQFSGVKTFCVFPSSKIGNFLPTYYLQNPRIFGAFTLKTSFNMDDFFNDKTRTNCNSFTERFRTRALTMLFNGV